MLHDITKDQQIELSIKITTLVCQYMKDKNITYNKTNVFKMIESISKSAKSLYLTFTTMEKERSV